MILKNKNILYYLFIILIAVIAFWEISSNYKTLKFDMIDASYPFQALQSQYELQGQIPLWDPYTLMGNAMHAKMAQWYPFRFISSKISEYTLQKLNFEFILHIILAGIGMFLFLKRLKIFDSIACALGCAYMLSSYFVGNAQHSSWIISGALLPWVILCYYNFIDSPNRKTLLYFVFVFFSFVTGGYPAFSIVFFYAVVIYAIIFIITHWKLENFSFSQLIKYHVVAGLILILLFAIPIVSHSNFTAMAIRGNGVSLWYALQESLHIQDFMSLVFPFFSTVFTLDLQQDQSMTNMYVGWTIFVCALFSLRMIRQKNIQILWILTIFFILLSLGGQTPVRSFFYSYVPLWDMFRFPTLFRLFFIFTGILLAAFFIQENYIKVSKRVLLPITISISIICLVVAIYFLKFWDFEVVKSLTSWHGLVYSIGLSHAVSIQLFIISITLFIIWIVLYKFSPKYIGNNALRIIAFCIISEMLIATLAQSAFTVSSDANPKVLQTAVDKLPKTFSDTSIMRPAFPMYMFVIKAPLIQNNQIFYKQRAYDGYTSYGYKSTVFFEKSGLFKTVKNYPLAYFPDVVYPYNREDYNFSRGKIATLFTPNNDIVYQNFEKNVRIESTQGNVFTFKTSTQKASYLVFLQNWYPGWKATVDNKEVKIKTANFCCIAIKVPKGNHIVTFEYKPKQVIWAYYIFEISLYTLIVSMIFISIPSEYRKVKIIIPIVILLFFVIIEFKNHL